MASFGRTASPVMTMPSQSAHQTQLDNPFFPAQPSNSFGASSAWAQSLAQNASGQLPRGRKRSRDEAAENLDEREKAPPAVEIPKDEDTDDEDEWVMGPGMVLIKKNGYITDASNQSGSWLEEQAAAEEKRKLEQALLEQQIQAQDRPSLRSHKSSRLDVTASLPPRDMSVNRSSPIRDLSDPPSALTPEAIVQPIVDDFTLHLGIGWNRISDEEHIQAAARGWARYIENHFPISNAQIRLESKGLESYLVEANEGYFLFAENLRQGRLVSTDSQRALENLKSSPPVFDGPETMVAAESPKPIETEPVMDVDMI